MTDAAPYLVALFAMLFSAGSALTLIYTLRHFDSPEASSPSPAEQHAHV